MGQQRVSVDVRRSQLVEVALSIAEREGPRAVTARRVAAEAQISLGLVHYCFASTHELAARMAERMTEQLGEAALPSLATSAGDGDLRGCLGAALTAVWDQIEATRQRQLLTYELATYVLRSPGLEGMAKRQYETADRTVVELLETAARLTRVSWTVGVDELARLVVMALDGATLRWLSDHDSARALTSLSHVADMVAATAVPRRATPGSAGLGRNTA